MFDDYITQLYRNFLGREPDAEGLAYWNSQLQSGNLDAISLTQTLLQSVEHQTIFKPIALMYYAALGRMPDEAGLVYWANEMRKGASIGTIAASIAASEEFISLHGQSSNDQFLIDLYDSALERAPDTAGLNFWKSVLEMGFDRATVMQFIATSPEMIKTRSEEVDFVLLYRGIFGVLPTQELVDATLPFRDLNALIETLYETPEYSGVDAPGVDRYVEPTPEPEPEPRPEPEPDSGPPPDSTAPSILVFLSSPTSLAVISSEAGSAGLYNVIGDVLIPSAISLPPISSSGGTDLTVSAQDTLTTARLRVFDTAGNSTFSPTLVKLGTSGNDTITASAAGDYMFGFGGNNALIGGIGQDIIFGGSGNDTITGGDGNDMIDGGGGNNIITDAGIGSDYIFHISPGATVAVGVTGLEIVYIDAHETGFSGTIANDVNGFIDALSSTAAINFQGGDGNDQIYSGDGNDTLTSGQGNDTIEGGWGDDTITGGAGADQINAGAGTNVINTGEGLDVVTVNTAATINTVYLLNGGAADLTTVVVTAGDERATTIQGVDATLDQQATAAGSSVGVIMNNAGLAGSVLFTGGDGADSLVGGENRDTLNGGLGNDTITGGFGANELSGGAGDDLITGDRDNDTITGGAGADSLTGGIGADTFFYNAVVGISSDSNSTVFDTITGLETTDFIDLNLVDVNNFEVATDVIFSSNAYTADTNGDSSYSSVSDVSILTTGGLVTTDLQAQAMTVLNAVGTTGADIISGGRNNDTISGNDGIDTITGGAGADVLTGGDGEDVFLFNTGDVVSGETIAGGNDLNTIRVVTSTDFSSLTTATILIAGSIDSIQITDATTGTFLGSQLTGQAINVNGMGVGVSTLDVDVVGVGAVNLTNLYFAATGTGTEFVSGTDIVDIDGDTANNTITGTILADNVAGNDGNDILVGGTDNDTITGGAGADTLTGGDGADRFVYSAFAQGGNVVAGNSITALTAGDVITDFNTGVDKIDISAVATGTAAASNGTGNAGAIEVFDSRSISNNYGVGVITVDYDFSANNTASGVIDAILAGYRTVVALGAGDIAYFAILDAGAAGVTDDFYNIFAVQNNTASEAVDAGLKGSLINVTHVASTSAGEIVVASNFIL